MKYIFVINSFTIKEKSDELCQKKTEYCKNKKIDYKIEINSNTKSVEDILKKYQRSQDIIIAVGGDGIINRVANCIVNTKNTLSFIPYGTGNDFYKTVKKTIKEKESLIDIIKINNKYFINTACFGIDADVANNKNIVKTKLIPKKHKYNISLIYNFFKYKCRPLKIVIKGEILEDKFTTIAVCNGKYYGSGYNISPKASITDGLIDIYIAKKINKLSMLKLILEMKNGKHETSKQIIHYQAKKISIISPIKIKSNIDGEELISNKFDIEIIEKGLKLHYDEEMINKLINTK